MGCCYSFNSIPNEYYWFLKGNKYWGWDQGGVVSGPKSINEGGWKGGLPNSTLIGNCPNDTFAGRSVCLQTCTNDDQTRDGLGRCFCGTTYPNKDCYKAFPTCTMNSEGTLGSCD